MAKQLSLAQKAQLIDRKLQHHFGPRHNAVTVHPRNGKVLIMLAGDTFDERRGINGHVEAEKLARELSQQVAMAAMPYSRGIASYAPRFDESCDTYDYEVELEVA